MKIVSGGQTGVDRAALEWAIAQGVPHGGWCPKGRKAEDGIIPPEFHLTETDSDDYSIRTVWNVRDSDATVIFSNTATLTGGSLETAEFARAAGKPCLHLVAAAPVDDSARQLGEFIQEHGVRILNVAGSRASQAPDLPSCVKAVLSRALKARPAAA